MKFHPSNFSQVTLAIFVLFLSFSCNKDSDLLAEYVVEKPQSFLVNDVVVTLANNPIVIAPLSNDNFKEPEKVVITQVTPPTMGSAVVNEDNTITYTPNTDETGTDEFDYSTSVTNPDKTVTEETGSVTVTVTDKTPTSEEPVEMGGLMAFPGAEGFGKNATGGRGGIVVEVTNLNDSGSGSLRDALKMTVPRTIVFKVGGTINCSSYLSIPSNSGDVTIAGQTAPGDGIAIKGAEFRIQASNVIMRYLRIRPGSSTSGSNEDGVRIIAFSGKRTENVILDHISITWGKDENVEIGGIGSGSNVRNVTIQNSIIAENINTQYGLLLWNDAKNISIVKNLFAHNKERNIRSSTCTSNFEMINNVVYGYKGGTHPTYENEFDIIGNVYKKNPAVSTPYKTINIEASLNNCPDGVLSQTRAYINDNILDGGSISVSSSLSSYKTSGRIFNSGVVPLSSKDVEQNVLSNVGANFPKSDAVDTRLINDAKNKTGNLTKSTGAYPNLSNGTPYSDKDKDGISDVWESANGLNPNDASDKNKDRDGDGYTNLEEFMHYLTIK
jgi:hypothetical protein